MSEVTIIIKEPQNNR